MDGVSLPESYIKEQAERKARQQEIKLEKLFFIEDVMASMGGRQHAAQKKGGSNPGSPTQRKGVVDTSDLSQMYTFISKQDDPMKCARNKGPFDLFAVIDGHGGEAVAVAVKKHLMDVVVRNRNIMVEHCYAKGLQEVFVKLEDLLKTKAIQKEMLETLGLPEVAKGTNY